MKTLLLCLVAVSLGACSTPRFETPPPINLPKPDKVKASVARVGVGIAKAEVAQDKAEAAARAVIADPGHTGSPEWEEKAEALRRAQAEQRKAIAEAQQAAALAAEEAERLASELTASQNAVDGQTGALTKARKGEAAQKERADGWRSWFFKLLAIGGPIVAILAFCAGVFFSAAVKGILTAAKIAIQSRVPF